MNLIQSGLNLNTMLYSKEKKETPKRSYEHLHEGVNTNYKRQTKNMGRTMLNGKPRDNNK